MSMTMTEALRLAEECKKNGNISTSAKAMVKLAEVINELQGMIEEGTSLGDIAYRMAHHSKQK
jgi:hypothetical protein